jgi:hypothetical protein
VASGTATSSSELGASTWRELQSCSHRVIGSGAVNVCAACPHQCAARQCQQARPGVDQEAALCGALVAEIHIVR